MVQASVIGVGMTPMSRRDFSVEEMTRSVAEAALEDAGVQPSELGLVLVGNALGGRLCDQGSIRGQSWLRGVKIGSAPVFNVDNSCGSGSSAFHLGVMAAQTLPAPVLTVGVEKMWTGDRSGTLSGIEDALPADERQVLREELAVSTSGSVFMGLNLQWMRHQLKKRGTKLEEIAATAVKARRMGARNELAQARTEVTVEEVLQSQQIGGELTRLMCSSFTDGAAAAVLVGTEVAGSPRVLASVAQSGLGELEYHQRIASVADEAWKTADVGPHDLDVVEVHDATSAEEIYAVESLGLFPAGEGGAATASGATTPNGGAVCVNPSGGLVARGHPIGATGLCQLFEIIQQLRGHAGERQVRGARAGAAVNAGGIVAGDAAVMSMHILAMV